LVYAQSVFGFGAVFTMLYLAARPRRLNKSPTWVEEPA